MATPPPGPARRPASLTGLAGALTRMLPLMALVAAGSTFALLRRAALVGDPDGTSLEDAATADDLVNGIGALGAALFLATGVVWIIWQYRHATNAILVGPPNLAPGWAIVGWFIPLGNLVLPQMTLAVAAKAGGRRAPVAVIGFWIGTSGIAAVLIALGTVLRPTGDDADDLDAFQLADRLVAAGAATAIVAALLAIVIVRRLSADQAAALGGGSRSGAWPPSGAWSPSGPSTAPAYGSAPPYRPAHPGMPPASPYPPPPGPSGWGPPRR